MAEPLTAEEEAGLRLELQHGPLAYGTPTIARLLATLDAARAAARANAENAQAYIVDMENASIAEHDAMRRDRDAARAESERRKGLGLDGIDREERLTAKYDRLLTIAAGLAPELAALRALADAVELRNAGRFAADKTCETELATVRAAQGRT